MSKRTHPSAWSLWPTLAATWVAFAQVVSFQGLVIWVVGGSLLTAGAVLSVAFARRRTLALVLAALVPFVVAVLAETLGGDSAGPITRATLMACTVTAVMAIVLSSQYSMWIVPLSLVLLCGALGLGAADQVLWLVGLWTVAAALTLSMLGPYRQRDLRDRRRLVPYALMLTIVGIIAVVSLVGIAPFIGTPWTMPGTGTDYLVSTVSVVTPSTSPDSTSPIVEPQANESESVSPLAADAQESVIEQAINWLIVIVFVLLLIALLFILIALVRRAWIGLRWIWLRRRLGRGDHSSRVIGAWTWVRLRRMRYDQPLPPWMSPDVAENWAEANGESDLAVVAGHASLVAFSTDLGSLDLTSMSESAWVAARRSGGRPPASLRQRWTWSVRGPRVSDLYCVSATR